MRIASLRQPTFSTTAFIQRRPVIAFAALSVLCGWLPLIFAPVLPYVPVALLSAAAPLLAAFLVSAAGKDGTQSRTLFHLPSGIQWYIALIVPVLWGVILVALNQLFPDGKIDYPLVPILLFAAALVYVFATGERVAWRGYVLPRLLKRHTPFRSSLIMSVLFLLVYLPMYWLGTLVDSNEFPLSPAFMAGVMVLYVWSWQHWHIVTSIKQYGVVRMVLRSVGRGALAVAVAIVAMLATAYLYQAAIAELDKRNFPPPGQLVVVGGHVMHIYCTGQGSPTVVLESGAFSFSAEWHVLQQQVEQTNRICSYDRAGNGWSEAVAGPRDGLMLVRELHTLLQQADERGPYVLAGHSLGGVLDTIYASQYPTEVIATVLVDSAIPTRWPDRDSYDRFVTQNQSAYSVMSVLARLGLIRPVVNGEFRAFGYPAAIVPGLTALKAKTQGVDTWDAEVRLAQWDLYQQLQAAAHLGQLPVVVMWASHPELTAPADRQRLQAIWDSFPVVSSNQVTRIVEGANHGSIIGQSVYVSQIRQAILDVIDSAHTGRPLEP